MPAVFEIGYPTYHELKEEKSLNDACLLTFLTILSQVPDTLISRKYGSDEALKISMMTRDLLNLKDESDFMEKVKTEEYGGDAEFEAIRSELPQEIIDNDIKSGVLASYEKKGEK